MSQVSAYQSIPKRTFQSALIHLLETEYKVVGSHRILQMIAEDVDRLREAFFPETARLGRGYLVWTATADEGQKAQPGKRTEEYGSVTVALPLVTDEDIAEKLRPCPRSEIRARSRERDVTRLVRVVKAAEAQGALLTIAELSVILNRGQEVIRQYVQEHYARTGELLPLKGYRMDQGASPTHKGQVIDRYERGMEPPDIARETRHSLKSVDRYLKDYERVKVLLGKGLNVQEISHLVGRGPTVVREYLEIATRYHPDLTPGED
jgi:hypothetical protein